MKAKLVFASMAFLAAVGISLLLTYLYGAAFLHDRYWHGTVARVQVIQAKLVVNLVREGGILQKTYLDTQKLREIFNPLDKKMVVEIRQNNEVIFSNQHEGRTKAKLVDELRVNDASIQLYAYVPPSWNYQFLRWIKNPGRWFQISFNFITAPFIFFFMMILPMFYALGWRMRSKYLSRDVLEILNARQSVEQ